jgi:hypothetical protein
LASKCVEWAAGVDPEYWKPNPDIERTHVLIFAKPQIGPIPDIADYAAYLESNGYSVDLIEYGTFTQEEYRSKLNRAKFLVGFVASESQGIAWAEAWSMDVPTLIWKNDENNINGRKFSTSSAPYLSEVTGLFFENFEEFIKFAPLKEGPSPLLAPRKWILESSSDEISAKNIYRLIGRFS